jgi:uncharacterized membrane protein YciS (DUF1049 family)
MEIATLLALGFSSLYFPLAGLFWYALRKENMKKEKIVKTLDAFRRRR